MAVQFRGRSSERAHLARLLRDARSGQSAVLVIRGEAGIGKTSLLRDTVEQAAGFQVARIAGVESEIELAYAGLHQLCTPMLDQLDALSEPQQVALNVALGVSSGEPLRPLPMGGESDEPQPLEYLQNALDDLVQAEVLEPARRPNIEYPTWATVHGLAVLLRGPLRALPDREKTRLETQTLAFIGAALR